MIRKLLPVLLAVVGLGLGLGAGYFLKPAADSHSAEAPAAEGEAAPAAAEHGAAPAEHGAAEAAPAEGENVPEYVKLTNQFVVPLINGGKVGSMVILSLSVEVKAGETADVYTKEPKLRDAFLQVMFDHANAGGFDGSFTDSANMIALRKALLEIAQQVLGVKAMDVLITDIVRQDT
jgi:flagellar protein FliL